MNILLTCGETSGEYHAGLLVSELKKIENNCRIIALGGEKLRRAGAEVSFPMERYALMGFSEIISGLPGIISLERKLKAVIEKGNIDLFIPVDYPGMNLRLAKFAHRRGVPVLYFISPQVWAWGKWRIKKMKGNIDLMTVILPFEKRLYEDARIPVYFARHPALEEIAHPGGKKELPEDQKDFKVLLFPGSRLQEVKRILPPILEGARNIHKKFPSASFILGLAPMIKENDIEIPADIYPYIKVSRKGLTKLKEVTLVLAASGTVTLQTAISGTPMITIYKTSVFNYLLGKILIQIPYVALPNVLAGRMIVPEMIQGRADGENIATEALDLLTDADRYRKVSGELLNIREKLKGGGKLSDVAEMAFKLARGENIEAKKTRRAFY